MNATGWDVVIGLATSLLAMWLVLVVILVVARPKGASVREVLSVLPDTLRLVRRLVADRSLPRGVRWRLMLLMAYLAMPFDLVPDFLPVIGHLDDAVVVILTLRSVVRAAGADAIKRHWPGSEAGLGVLWKLGGLPGEPPSGSSGPGTKAHEATKEA
jgi:uncharacterized membrane protein YkvA (DUF1232 family)